MTFNGFESKYNVAYVTPGCHASRFKMRCSQRVKIKLFADQKKLFNHYSEALKFLKTYRFIQICECINVKFYDFCSFQKLKDFLLYCKSYIFLYINQLKIYFLLHLSQDTFLLLNNTECSE